QIIYGHKAQDINELTSMVAQKQWPQLLKYKNVSQGDFYFVPVGTVHAILKGIKVLEIQQSSDVTYRLYDYDRVDRNGKKRDLHLKEALPVITYHNQSNRANLETNHMIQRLVSNQYFTVDKIKLDGSLILHGNNTYSIIYTNEDLEIEI